MITVDVKKEVIEKHERGRRVADMHSIKEEKHIRGLEAGKGVTRVLKQWLRVLKDAYGVDTREYYDQEGKVLIHQPHESFSAEFLKLVVSDTRF